MSGLFVKMLRETWLMIVLIGAGLALFEGLVTVVLPQVQTELAEIWLRMPFARQMLGALLGIEIREGFTREMLHAILFVHPIVLALFWAHELMFCTRAPAAEIDRGTIDVLLGLPVSRGAVYGVDTLGWLLSGIALIVMSQIGYQIGTSFLSADHRLPARSVLIVLANLYCLYLAVGGLTFLLSTLSDRRGRAVAVIFGVVLVSFLINFLAALWEPMRRISWLSVLEYYQPAQVILDGEIPWTDMIVLTAIGAVAWIAGYIVFARRSICTV